MAENQNITASEIMEKVERQAFLCALSGRDLRPANASLDHIDPLARGGDHTIDNVWVVDKDVNSAKGTLTADEFIQLCREVARYQDGMDEIAAGLRD